MPHLLSLSPAVRATHVDDEVIWRSDGTSFPVECRSYPIRENNVLIGGVVTFVDISERRRAEHTQQQSAGNVSSAGREHPRNLFYRNAGSAENNLLSARLTRKLPEGPVRNCTTELMLGSTRSIRKIAIMC